MTDDQKAMLRLLAQREEGYEDMAALMGISVEEVRERVKEALAEVDEADESDLPAEQAPAPTPAPASPPPSPSAVEPKAEEPAKLADPVVPAPPPEPQAPIAKVAGPGSRKRQPRPPLPKLPKDRGALIGLGAGALVVLIFVVVLIVAGDGGSSDSGSTTTSAASGSGETTTATAGGENLTEAILAPTNGGESSGRALFGRYKKSVLLQVQAEGLDPSPKGQTYTIWLYRSPKIALQIGSVPVGAPGKIAAQFQIPPQLLAYVANGAFDQVDVALTDTATYQAALAKAKGERKLPAYTGESVLRGDITGPAIKQQ